MANAFRFRLSRVQRIRELHEEMAKADFANALGAAHQAAQYVEFLRGEIASARESLAQLQTSARIDPRSMVAKDKTVQAMLTQLGPARQRHAQLQQVAEVEREKWMLRKSDAQALEKLEKRHRDRHVADVAQKENEQQDEVAIARAFARGRAEKQTEKSEKGFTSPFREFQGAPDRDGRGHSPAQSPS